MRTNNKLFKLLITSLLVLLAVTQAAAKEQVVILTAANTKRIQDMQEKLSAKFPDYDFVVEYVSTGKLAAKLLAEGTSTECDIIHDLQWAHLTKLSDEGYLADLPGFDYSRFLEDTIPESRNWVIECRVSGCVALNMNVLKAKGLPEPASWEDLLKPEYKGLISMANPKSSSSGYMFVKMLANTWGEDKALGYFEKLGGNIPQFTSGGNGPANALVSEEAAIALAMTTNIIDAIMNGEPLKILFFKEGAPCSLYGQAIVKGKENKPGIKEIFDYMTGEFFENHVRQFHFEQVFKYIGTDYDTIVENVPYGDMSNDTITEKERLLEEWPF